MAPPPSSAAEVRSPCWRRAIHRATGQCSRHISLGPAGRSFQRQARRQPILEPSQDPSEADSTPFTGRNVADCHRSPFSPPLPAITRSTSLHILPAESERRIAALATLPAERRSTGYGAGRGAARVAAGRRRSLPRVYGQALAAGDVYTVAGAGTSSTRRCGGPVIKAQFE